MSDEEALRGLIRAVTGAEPTGPLERVQSLWGGYGEILRARLEGGPTPSVIVKRVSPPPGEGLSHARKVRSYAVERAFYLRFAPRDDQASRVASCLAAEQTDEGFVFVLEDLDAAGYGSRRARSKPDELDACLRWLARFHARFLGVAPDGLWEEGSYWHLATRPDELAALRGFDDAGPELVRAAHALDAALTEAKHRTLVHGDAKLANFCFADDGRVAAVDFQYVGGGAGVRDVAYLLFGADGWGRRVDERAPLDRYFTHLREALAARGDVDAAALEAEWRALYPIARADFARFYAGWAPSPASRRAFAECLRALDATRE